MSGFDSNIYFDVTGYGEANPVYLGLASQHVKSPFMFPRPTDDQVRDAHIAIVDDDPITANLVQTHLQAVGFRKFSVITDSSTAHAVIATSLPDIVILDLLMCPVTGWNLLDSLRRDDRTQHIPILMQTSDTDEATRINAFNLGVCDFLTKPVVPTELIARVRNTLSAKIYRDRMTQYSLQLEFDVLTDSLTGIANRRAFDYELRRRLVDWNRQRIPLCLLLLDVDHFKQTNDRYGHQAGDAVLVEIANKLKRSVRELDLVARFGGEEFAVILPYSTAKDGRCVAERARQAIENHPIAWTSHQFRVTASFGIAEVRPGDDAELLIRRADAALYSAKHHGRNRSCFHTGTACEPIIADGAPPLRHPPVSEAKAHLDSLSDYSNALENEAALRASELAASCREAIQCLARAAEMRDDNAGRHTIRVGKYAAIVGKELGFGSERLVWLEHAAQLHDVGKIGVPDSILLKPGSLTREEFQTMQQHCSLGRRIIRNEDSESPKPPTDPKARLRNDSIQSPLMQMAAVIAETHHERWDGTGYPRGLKGEEIPLEGRITAVADVFDALSSARPYKKAMPLEKCFTILSENRGSHFDPLVLDAFFRCKSEIVRTFHEYSDNGDVTGQP